MTAGANGTNTPGRNRRAGRQPWRIRDRATFERLRQSRRRVRAGPVTITYVDGEGAARARVAYAVGRSVGGAVERNRLRRRLRAAVAELSSELRPGAYLVAAGPEAATMAFDELRQLVREAIEATRQAGE